jgi:hypothetical protein
LASGEFRINPAQAAKLSDIAVRTVRHSRIRDAPPGVASISPTAARPSDPLAWRAGPERGWQ